MNRISFVSDDGLSPIWRHAIIWTKARLLLIGSLGANFSEILIEIQNFPFTKMHLKISSVKWRPFCPGERWVNGKAPNHVMMTWPTDMYSPHFNAESDPGSSHGKTLDCCQALLVKSFSTKQRWLARTLHHSLILIAIYALCTLNYATSWPVEAPDENVFSELINGKTDVLICWGRDKTADT